ncbi:MAG: DUF4351 domain-containing protein [bacterium]|nr:DUF4351 domain-containing protein [bacterium]
MAEQAPTWNEIWEQRGREKGRQEGRQEGESTLLLRLLEARFGPLDSEVRERVQSADTDRLLEWGERILRADRLEDVFED